MTLPRTAAKIAAFVLLCCGSSQVAHAASLTVAWDPPGDGITTGYILLYGTASHSYSQQINVGYTTTYTLNSLGDGTTYYLAVEAYDAAGTTSAPSAEITATTTTSAPAITSLSLTSGVPSPQLTGTNVSWLAAASGGTTPYEFQWGLYASGSWTLWPWSTSSSWSWTPTAAGDYQVSVAVRSSGSTSTTGELSQTAPYTIAAPVSSASLVSNLPSPQVVGTTIQWSASAVGGITPYQYQWWLYDGSVWTAMTSWTTSSTWSWTPTVANSNYIVRVWVRSATDSADAAEASASVAYAIKSATKTTCRGWKCK